MTTPWDELFAVLVKASTARVLTGSVSARLRVTCFASEKAHVVIVAIDDSGSMRQSDPERIRSEAT